MILESLVGDWGDSSGPGDLKEIIIGFGMEKLFGFIIMGGSKSDQCLFVFSGATHIGLQNRIKQIMVLRMMLNQLVRCRVCQWQMIGDTERNRTGFNGRLEHHSVTLIDKDEVYVLQHSPLCVIINAIFCYFHNVGFCPLDYSASLKTLVVASK